MTLDAVLRFQCDVCECVEEKKLPQAQASMLSEELPEGWQIGYAGEVPTHRCGLCFKGRTPHVLYECNGKDCRSGCMFCEGGLAYCELCHSFEGATTTDCPRHRMSSGERDRVYAGQLDFVNGHWIKTASPHSPQWYRGLRNA